jgi:hypothetical protein
MHSWKILKDLERSSKAHASIIRAATSTCRVMSYLSFKIDNTILVRIPDPLGQDYGLETCKVRPPMLRAAWKGFRKPIYRLQ